MGLNCTFGTKCAMESACFQAQTCLGHHLEANRAKIWPPEATKPAAAGATEATMAAQEARNRLQLPEEAIVPFVLGWMCRAVRK